MTFTQDFMEEIDQHLSRFMSILSQVIKELFHVVFTIPRPSRFHKGFATLRTVVLLDSIMALHMNDQCIALPECLGAQTALKFF